ncbi:hypothetical protein IPJ72_00440 [Candidatus Peregrinibacteria bacterium]|nr:MAG: hypothetical protein IPJ72_00440 [Candidatus Peregrinibacteria bacterium]
MKNLNFKKHRTFIVVLVIIALVSGIGYKTYFTTECPDEFYVDDSLTFGGGPSMSTWIKDGQKVYPNKYQRRWISKNCEVKNLN